MTKPEEDSFERLGHILEQEFMCPEQSLGCEGNFVNNNKSSRSSKKGVIKSRSNCNLKISRNSQKIGRRASIAPLSSVQIRRPIIIYTYSPKVIHTQPSNFMWLVQSLTGSCETRSRCLKSRPGELTADTAAAAASYSSTTIDTENSKSFGSSLGINNHARASSPHQPHGSREADFHQQQLSAPITQQLQANDETSPAPANNCHLSKEPARVTDCGISPNLPNSTKYSHTIEQLSSSYRITQNVSPRSPLSATEFEDAAAFSTTITTAPAPAFDNWSLDENFHLHNNTTIRSSSGLPHGPCLNYISKRSTPPHHLSGNHDFPFSYNTNATPWTVDSLLLSNKPIPIWESDTFLNDVMPHYK